LRSFDVRPSGRRGEVCQRRHAREAPTTDSLHEIDAGSKHVRPEVRGAPARIPSKSGAGCWGGAEISIRTVFDKTRWKPLAFAADAVLWD
jgi:hypothetical protein